jgi:RimJ/RimL family protein N-acetyltransferase
MESRHWPLFGLRIRTPRLTLRWPTLEDLDALADLAYDGIHDPAEMPFSVPWTDASPEERARATLQYHWSLWSSWMPARWTLELAVIQDGVPVGLQGIGATDFAVAREVHSGSWLGRQYQGRGVGTEMRAAVLYLAFAGLGAESATTSAYLDNHASLGVSRKLGYQPDGIERHSRRSKAVTLQRLRLDRARWEATRSTPVDIAGLTGCFGFFGLPEPGGQPADPQPGGSDPPAHLVPAP